MTQNTWRGIAVAYLSFYVIVIAWETHGLDRGPMSPLEKMLTAPILWGIAAHAVDRGSIWGRFSWIERSEKPVAFWLLVTFGFAFGLSLFFWGLRDAIH